jgi:hypothetical protein
MHGPGLHPENSEEKRKQIPKICLALFLLLNFAF